VNGTAGLGRPTYCMTKTLISALAGLLAMAALAAGAEAKHKHHRYWARHPVPVALGGGFCMMDGLHEHSFRPHDGRLYRKHRGHWYFVGDPVAFGYAGPRYAFYDPHPVVEVGIDFGEPVYCYLDGPHYHGYQPPAAAGFEVHAGVSWYVGGFASSFYQARPRYVVVNHAHRPIHYARPVVDVTVAPPAFRARLSARPVSRGGPPPLVVAPPVGTPIRAAPPRVMVRDRRDDDDDRDRRPRGWGRPGGWHDGGGAIRDRDGKGDGKHDRGHRKRDRD